MDIILASGSPRRRYLLQRMGVEFQIVPSGVDECMDLAAEPRVVAKQLAMQKAQAVSRKYPDAVVIGGDSIVVFDNRMLGKPNTIDEARSLLESYSGSSCRVISAVAVVCKNRHFDKVLSDTASVAFTTISRETIEAYLRTNNWVDKAGGFAVQHQLIKNLIARTDGRIDTLIGMPTQLLAQLLSECGVSTAELDPADRGLLVSSEML